MRIPKRVNAAWDWAESHGRVTAVVALLLIVALGTVWEPALATFALGLALGGLVVYQRLARRIDRLRREMDDVLRENGRLRHRATVLASGVVEAEALVTQQLLTIPEPEDSPDRTVELKGLADEILDLGDPEKKAAGKTTQTAELTELPDEQAEQDELDEHDLRRRKSA